MGNWLFRQVDVAKSLRDVLHERLERPLLVVLHQLCATSPRTQLQSSESLAKHKHTYELTVPCPEPPARTSGSQCPAQTAVHTQQVPTGCVSSVALLNKYADAKGVRVLVQLSSQCSCLAPVRARSEASELFAEVLPRLFPTMQSCEMYCCAVQACVMRPSKLDHLTGDTQFLFVVFLEIWDHHDVGGVFEVFPVAGSAAAQ